MVIIIPYQFTFNLSSVILNWPKICYKDSSPKVLKTFIIGRIFTVFSLDKFLPRVRPEFILQEKKKVAEWDKNVIIGQRQHVGPFSKKDKKTKHETFLHAGCIHVMSNCQRQITFLNLKKANKHHAVLIKSFLSLRVSLKKKKKKIVKKLQKLPKKKLLLSKKNCC